MTTTLDHRPPPSTEGVEKIDVVEGPQADWSSTEPATSTQSRLFLHKLDLAKVKAAVLKTVHDLGINLESTPVDEVLDKLYAASNLGLANNIFNPTRKLQRAEREILIAYALYSHLVRELAINFIKVHGRSITISVANEKGGAGKTLIASMIATHLSYATGLSILIVESNENTGTLDIKLGIPRGGQYQLADIARNPDMFNSSVKLMSRLPCHEQVSVFAAFSPNSPKEFDDLRVEQLCDAMGLGSEHAGGTVCDVGNDNSKASNLAAILQSDVLCVPMYVEQKESFNILLMTLVHLHENGHSELIKKHARFVVTGVKNDGFEDYELLLTKAAIDICRLTDEQRAEGMKPQVHEESWVNNHYQMLIDFGLITESSQKKIWKRIDSARFNVIRFSPWAYQAIPISVLPDDLGLETSLDALRLLHGIFHTKIPTKEFKDEEKRRRITALDEAEGKRLRQVKTPPYAENDFDGLTLPDLENLMRSAAMKVKQLKGS